MAIDQAHEQNNAAIKGDGGAIGLTQSPEALRRWMLTGPEMARLIAEFEASIGEGSEAHAPETKHHEQTKAFQVKFVDQVKAMVNVIEEMGNPFVEESNDVLRLQTRDIMDQSVVEFIGHAEQLAQEQYKSFVTDRLLNCKKPIKDPIQRNKVCLFTQP